MPALRVLGGLDVEGVASKALGSRKQRRLLARLVVAQGAVVSADALAEDLWGLSQPASPRDDLSVLVSRLRSSLPGGELVRRDGGYALDATWSDLGELPELQQAALEAAAQERWSAAAAGARSALALVRGPVLPEHADAHWVRAEQATVDTTTQALRLVLLHEDGTWLLVEPFAGDTLEENLNPVGRLFYGVSTALCTSHGISEGDDDCLGAQAGFARLTKVAHDAGFTRVRLAAQTPFNLIIEVRP